LIFHSIKSHRLTLALLLVIFTAGALFTWWMIDRTERKMRDDLLQQSRLVEKALNVDRIKKLNGTDADLEKPEYLRIKEQLTTLCSVIPQCRFLYLLGRKADGSMFFFLDSESVDSKDYSPPGQVYADDSEGYSSVFARYTERVEGPTTNRRGTLVSGLIPIYDKQTAMFDLATPADAQAMVRKAVDYYQKNGLESILREINNPQGDFCKGDIYAFAYDRGMTMLAHPVRPELVGQNLLDTKDWDGGKYFHREIQKIALSKGSGWVDYEYNNPANNYRDTKTTYIERVDDLIICAGAYKGAGSTLAVLGMDIDARDWNWMLVRAALPTILLTLVLAAMLLIGSALFAWRARFVHAQLRWLRHLETGLMVAVGLVLTLFATWMAHTFESRYYSETFEKLAASRTEPIATTLRTLRGTELEGLAHFYEKGDNIASDELRQFTTYLTKNPSVFVWEWIPAVPSANRARFEAMARAAGLTGFEIWEKDAQGKRVPAAGREVYYPVFQAAPLVGNERALGYDLGSDPLRRATLEEAVRSNLPTATDPITLVQETGSQKGMLIYRTVFGDDNPKRLLGFTLAALRMGTLISGTSDNMALLGLSLVRKNAAPDPLATSWISDSPPAKGPSMMRPIFAFGKVFAVTAHAGPEFMKMHPMRAGWQAFLVGLVLTAAFAFVIRLTLHQRDELERLVAERTAELQITAAQLNELNVSLVELTVRSNRMATLANSASAAKSEFLSNMSHEIRRASCWPRITLPISRWL